MITTLGYSVYLWWIRSKKSEIELQTCFANNKILRDSFYFPVAFYTMDLTKVLLLVGCAVASTYFTYANFTSAFPMLSLELKMSKAEAQDAAVAARVLATFESRPFLELEQDGEGGGKTPAYMSAASFGGDDEVQHYIELAGGGNEAFKSMIARVR